MSSALLAEPPTATPSQAADSERVAELLVLVAAGDSDAFAQLYDLMSPRVFSVIRALLIDVGQAEEVTQEVFLETWQRAHNFDAAKGSGSGWVLRLARSRAVDRIRHAQATKSHEGSYARRTFQPAFDSVSEHVVQQAECHQLRSALAGLSALNHEAIVLAYFGDHTYLEASELLGVPLSTFKSRIRGALADLRRAPNLAS